jgi:hypothetical protein
MTIDGVEMRWLAQSGQRTLLQYRLNTRSVNGIMGLVFGHTDWKTVPVVMEEDADD